MLYSGFFQLLLKLLFQGLFDAITEYREKNKDVYGIKNSVSVGVYQPWTAREGNTGIRSHIQQQVCIELIHIYLYVKYLIRIELFIVSMFNSLNILDIE